MFASLLATLWLISVVVAVVWAVGVALRLILAIAHLTSRRARDLMASDGREARIGGSACA